MVTTLDKNDGGNIPAFPIYPRIEAGKTSQIHGAVGMTLRDYFAAKAMPMLAAEFYRQNKQLTGGTVADLVAPVAYGFADAMLKERAK